MTFLSPHKVICYEWPAKCGGAYSIARCRDRPASEKSKVIAFGWSVWWIENWLCSLCGGARSDSRKTKCVRWELFSNSLTMELCALRRKCSDRKHQSSVSSDPSVCRASANGTCLPISARPWLHRGAISRSSTMTVNQKTAEGQKNILPINSRVAWASNDYVSTSRASELVADTCGSAMVQRTLNCLFNDLSRARAIREPDLFSAKVNNKNHAYEKFCIRFWLN